MTITQSLEALSTWLAENVCPKIDLKCPSDNNAEHYETVKPASFAMYLPTKEKLPPGIKAESPSVVTQLIEGTHTMTEGRTRLKLQLSFTSWNPGIHPGESSTGAKTLERNSEGWKDVWNFVERALQEIENAEYLNGLRVVKEQGITFGQFQQEEQVSDLYPYWSAWAILTVEQGLARTAEAYKEFL